MILVIFSHGTGAIQELLKNPCRPKDIEKLVADWALMRVLGETARRAQEDVASVLGLLIESGHVPVQHPVMHDLPDMLEAMTGPGEVTERLHLWIFTVLKHRELSPDRLAKLYEVMRPKTTNELLVSQIISHPRTPPEVWRHAVANTKLAELLRGGILEACITKDEVRRDPAVRSRLIEEALIWRPEDFIIG